tara:strand:- start:5022 stop:6110 length:1089 start_codon:yes stop_codon:yes gene_type:complete
MSASAKELGQRIIEINRKVRLGSTTTEQWRERLDTLIAAQPDFQLTCHARDVRFPEGGAGSSSGTLFFTMSHEGDHSTRECVLRFEPAERLFHAYDLDGQVRIQRALSSSPVPVPAQICEDIDGEFLKVPGYVMERASGEAAPGAWFAEGVIADSTPADRRKMILAFVETLAKIHQLDWRAQGLSFLLRRAVGPNLIGREINWYWDGLSWAGEIDAQKRFSGVRDWLLANEPEVPRPVLCHGDANFTNYLFKDNLVSAVLDWEMAFIGAPEADLAYALIGMSSLSSDYPPGTPSDDEMKAAYEAASGATLQHWEYYSVFALYRIVLTHILGLRAFPEDFQAAFQSHVEGLIARLNAAWSAAK